MRFAAGVIRGRRATSKSASCDEETREETREANTKEGYKKTRKGSREDGCEKTGRGDAGTQLRVRPRARQLRRQSRACGPRRRDGRRREERPHRGARVAGARQPI